LYDQEKYTIDFADFEEKIVSQGVKLFILCSPHNPVSRVWTREELTRMGDICCRHGVTVISDEIHADFSYPGHRHLVFAGLKPAFADISIVCTAPTKTFNLAGLSISNIFIPNGEIRRKVKQEIAASGLGQISIMGLVACKAAYKEGHEWLAALREYLSGNLAFLRDYLAEKIPSVQLVEPEGTYLVWLDFRGLGLSDQALDDLIVHKARLWLDAGAMFGAGGEGFQRINIACPRAILEQALVQLEQAIQSV
jgi:cystathionine beta-lyase